MSDLQNWGGKSVGIEVADDLFMAVAVATGGELIDARSESFDPAGDSVSQLAAFVTRIAGSSPGLDRVGVAVPGLIDRATGRVEHSVRFPGHSAVDIAATIERSAKLRAVIENDANAAAFGELKAGAGKGSRNLFYATFGTGVGGAFILNGQLWRGDSGFAGEFGNVVINSEGLRLEDVASAASIVRRARSRISQDSTSSLSRLAEQEITIAEIVGAAEQEDDLAQLLLERTGKDIGTAISSVINLLDVERIVVGGKIMMAKHLVLDAIIERARGVSFAPSFRNTSIVPGELGENAAAIGAALIAAEG
jgi:glucokinase